MLKVPEDAVTGLQQVMPVTGFACCSIFRKMLKVPGDAVKGET
jgi:hypothetical protein